MKIVAALYVDDRGPYMSMVGVDPWPASRDARRYKGPHPIVAHPVCGPWGSLRKQNLDDPDLAIRAVEQVREFGGVLEHPRGSRLWQYMDLPKPGALKADNYGGWSLALKQVSWGHPCCKPTWIYMVRVDKQLACSTMRRGGGATHMIGGSVVSRHGLLAASKRIATLTPQAFAEYLVSIARSVQ